MTALKKQALREAAQEEIMLRSVSDTSDAWQDEASPEAVLALLDELEAAESKCRELAARTVKLPDINEFLAEVHDKTLNLAFRRLAEGVREADIYAIRAAGIGVKGE